MKKRRHWERSDIIKPTPAKDSSIILEGDTLPEELRMAIELVHTGKAICRISHKKKKVAIVHAKWIPLIQRLEMVKFSLKELTALDWSVFDEEHTPEKRSQEVVAWAKSLK